MRYLLDQIVREYSLTEVTIANYLLRLTIFQPPPDKDEDAMVTKLRTTLSRSLEEVRKGAE